MILKIYDFLRNHAFVRWAGCLALTLMLVAAVVRLTYKEEIRDFLPLRETERERMAVCQEVGGMERLFVVFETPKSSLGGVEETTEAIGCFVRIVEESDTAGWCQDLQATFDTENLMETMDFVLGNAPLFLKAEDYRRMDSLLALPDFMGERLEADVNALMFPAGGLLSGSISSDPLGLFAPLTEELQPSGGGQGFEIYDGYIFTPDMSRAIVMLSSPFGSSETEMNGRLIAMLDEAIGKMQAEFPEIEARVVGAPAVAVGNARQIMKDSILAVSLAAILILALLLYAFRSFRDIGLIALSVSWGWLFALGGLALVRDSVSMIVIGISSIIIGIAVNYPLHLIAHTKHQPDVRQALGDIKTPLLVGNITTVGAFLALVPLKSVALRDLGLFASFLLLGTILFVLVWLPQILKGQGAWSKGQEKCFKEQGARSKGQEECFKEQGAWSKGHEECSNGESQMVNGKWSNGKCHDLLTRLASVQIERKGWLVVLVAVLTPVFGYFCLSTEFDSDLSNINFMTEQQRADMRYFESLMSQNGRGDTVSLYLVSSAEDFEGALACSESRKGTIDSLKEAGLIVNHRGVDRFLPSMREQQERIERWNKWIEKHPELLRDLNAAASRHGFAEDAFSTFAEVFEKEQAAVPFDDFAPLTTGVLANRVAHIAETGRSAVVDVLFVRREDAGKVREALPEAFDMASQGAAVAKSLSDDFNYVGWACSLIVFLFLWLSFRRIELAIIAFIPMAVSWIWILGIMSMLGIKFNIVNIILATFIFGQGDDYTIFMTEGCISEYEHGKPVLASYKRSIILSALIMFIGIGTLIMAKHPALHSLAEVTIVGMFSVVLMAYLLPPLLFKWVMKSEELRMKSEECSA